MTVSNLFCYCFPWERLLVARDYLLETSVILFCYCCLLVLSALWSLSLALIVGHLVLLKLFFPVLGVQWFLSLVHFFLFLFWFPAISVAFWHCSLLTSCFLTTTIVLVFFVPHVKLVYLALFLLLSIFKVSFCTRALVLDVFCFLSRWIHH